ncbi:TonB-dependent receptor domain-containing protein [Limnohabitans sp.]|uniref:TonB-dependent receptor plug domain-containing protein n=1 Tax=Limnohabitans sp. TaxID=1907725 RepID=UPI00286F1406|nr:TonB-dependent receptor [Limnohabitans sp.]
MKKFIRPRARAIARFATPALSVLSLAVAASVQAQDIEINPVVVVSSRVNEQLSDVLPSVSVINKSDIEKFRYADLYELLSGQAGMQLTRAGGAGNPTSVFMRGANSTQTLVLVDGIPFASQGAIGAISPLEAIPVAQVERVEIFRGNASAVYGPGAAGGVIQIFTQSATALTEGVDVKAEMGSLNSRTLQTSMRKNLGDGQLSLTLSDNRSDGISTLTPARYSNLPNIKVNPDRNGFDSQSLGLGWRQNLSVATQLAFHYLNTSTLASYDNPYANSTSERWGSKSKLELGGAQLSHRISEVWKTTLTYGQSISKLSTLTNDILNADYGTSNSRQQQLKWDNLVALGNETQITFGYGNQVAELDTGRTSYDNNASPVDIYVKKSVRQERFFGGVNQQVGAWSWRANLSYEQLPGSQSGDTYLVGAGYELNRNYKITLTRSTAIQSPTVGQLYDVAYGGNVALKPEHSSSTEVGLQFKDDNSFWRVVAFDVQYKDMIAASTNPVGDPFWAAQYITQLENLSSTQNKGFEFAYARKWASWGAQLAYTSQNPENLNSSRPIQNRAKRFGSVTVSHFLDDRTSLNAKVLATSDQWTPMTGSFSSAALVPGYAVLNLSADHKVRPDVKLTLSVLNALDKTYFHLDGYNNPGRSYFMGLKYAYR